MQSYWPQGDRSATAQRGREILPAELHVRCASCRIENASKRMGQRPRATVEQIEREIAGLEYKRSTVTMSLVKEKQMLAQVAQEKAKIRDIKVRQW